MYFEEMMWIAGACLGIVIVCALIWTFYNKSKYNYLVVEEMLKIDRQNKIVLLKYDDMDFLLVIGRQNLLLHKSKLGDKDGASSVESLPQDYKKHDPLSKINFVYQDK